ncbi:MAG: ABC transporter substrate-binding protein [Clostridiales Family XIII bacterium]|jgi:polar amino acid transport system substrate-binding protein|nr:ABC transporter substrate-binding protein [Clostridiales Family XIII bacterium]
MKVNFKRRMLCLVTSLACALSLAACGAGNGAGGDTELGLLNSGVLKVGVEVGYPPFETFDDDGVTLTGLDIELATEIANILGVEVEFEDTAWDGIFSGLSINKYDCVISAVTVNPERAKTMDFSTPYIENWQSIVIRKGTPAVASMGELDGLDVGYQDATSSDEYLDELQQTGVLSCTVHEYDKILNAFDDLKLERVNAILCDSTVAEAYVEREPDVFEISWIQSSEPGVEPEKFAVALNKGNIKLLEAVNSALQTLEENGKLDEIRDNWL